MKVITESDFEFRHLMRDIVILPGGRLDIADLLDKSQDGTNTADVDAVRRYAVELFTEHKNRLNALHKMQLHVGPKDGGKQ